MDWTSEYDRMSYSDEAVNEMHVPELTHTLNPFTLN